LYGLFDALIMRAKDILHRFSLVATLALLLSMAACSSPKMVTNSTIPSPTIEPTYLVPSTSTPTQAGTATPMSALTLPAVATASSPKTRSPTNTFTPTLAATISVNTLSTQASKPSLTSSCPTNFVRPAPTVTYDGTPGLLNEGAIALQPYLLDYLNHYGAEALIIADHNARFLWGDKLTRYGHNHIEAYQDFTNDGVPELAYSFLSFYIFGCKDGKYDTLLALEPNDIGENFQILAIKDLNRNGMPEVLLSRIDNPHGYYILRLVEWDGSQFNNLFVSGEIDSPPGDGSLYANPGWNFGFEDLDKDGMPEYVIHDGIPIVEDDYYSTFPWRKETDYYKWDGSMFALYRKYFSPAEYRFQAVQDADLASSYREYDRAQELYQQVIFSDKLEWWSPERSEYEIISFFQPDVAPTLLPLQPDPAEMDHLAAYARFRMMLLYVVQGWMSDAQVVYDTLQKKYPENTDGHIYAQMARAFWTEYAVSGMLDQACGKAVQVANQSKEEATRYLGSDYHGYQSLKYQPQDLCPFR
jgi:hypothetical protein